MGWGYIAAFGLGLLGLGYLYYRNRSKIPVLTAEVKTDVAEVKTETAAVDTIVRTAVDDIKDHV